MRYGNATWVDAAGQRIALAAHRIDGAIEIAVPEEVLRGAAYPAMIDPVIGPEIAVDVPVTAAPADQRIPRTAFDGTNFVVVWQDRRGTLGWDIYGARVDATGRVVGTRNFVVASVAGPQEQPDVACMAGSDCVAVWSSAGDIFAAKIPLGTGDPGVPFAVSTAPNTQATPHVACDNRGGIVDRRCLVTYFDVRGGAESDIYGRRIKPDGIDGSPELVISSAAGSQFGPEITFAGSQYVVAWQDGGSRPCAIASDGANALVVYTSGTLSPMPLFAQRVDATTGAAVGSALRVDTGNAYNCSADWDGTNYLAAWPDASLKPMGRVAFGGGAHLVIWEDTRTIGSTGYDIYGARVAPGLTRSTRIDTLISLVPASWGQFTPDVTRNFQSYFVVWSDARAGATDIYGARFDFAGRLLDPMGIAISAAATPQAQPAVASDNKVFFIVWEDSRGAAATGRDIYGARIDESGGLLDPTGFAVSTAVRDQGDPDIAFDASSQRFQVVWSDLRSGTNTDIYGTQIDRTAAVLSPAGSWCRRSPARGRSSQRSPTCPASSSSRGPTRSAAYRRSGAR